MFKLGVKKAKITAPATSGSGAEAPLFLQADDMTSLRKRGGWMRTAGNLLIVVGVLMLVGIGGWLGYREWEIQQDKQRFEHEFGTTVFEPVSDAANPTPTLPPPPPKLNVQTTGMLGILNKLP